jgi:hypothetical protein
MKDVAPFPCPCCGYFVFQKEPGSHDICPICFWEDDLSQLRFPMNDGGANRPSLQQAQVSYQRTGACEERLLGHVRGVLPDDTRDPDWRPIDLDRDPIEVARTGVDYGCTYPLDTTAFYYWRRRTD